MLKTLLFVLVFPFLLFSQDLRLGNSLKMGSLRLNSKIVDVGFRNNGIVNPIELNNTSQVLLRWTKQKNTSYYEITIDIVTDETASEQHFGRSYHPINMKLPLTFTYPFEVKKNYYKLDVAPFIYAVQVFAYDSQRTLLKRSQLRLIKVKRKK